MTIESTFNLSFNDIDRGARDNIIKLNKKLSALRLEVDSKLQSMDLDKIANFEQEKQHFVVLIAEIDSALNQIHPLVDLVEKENKVDGELI